MKDEALDLALEALILKTGMNPVMQGSCYVMHPEALQAVIDEAIKQALAAPVQPVAWKWQPAPVKTSWGHEMVVADLAIDKDHTVSIYCERDQKAKVEAMFAKEKNNG